MPFVNNMNTAFFLFSSLFEVLVLTDIVVLSFTLPMILWAVDMAVQGCKYHCRGSPAPLPSPKTTLPPPFPVPLHL